MSQNTIPTIFSGCLPSLRHLSLPKTLVWPVGLFRGLTSFECGTYNCFPVFPVCVFDVIRGSPSIESLRVVGCCKPIEGLDIPPIPLSSLRKCILIGEGVAPLIRFIAVPATALVSLSKPYVIGWTALPEFSEHSVAPALRILGEISAFPFSFNDYPAQLQAWNNHGGVLDVMVDGLEDLSRDPHTFVLFMRSSFECWGACPGLKTTKSFTLFMDRDRVWCPEEARYIALDLTRLISNLPGIKEAKFHGVPPVELAAILGFLARAQPSGLQCPNLRRLDIVSSPIPSPKSLLMAIDSLLETRKEAGVPLRSVTVRVKCEVPVPVVVHCAFLAVWEGLVGEGVRLEYERTKVKELSEHRRRTDPEGEEEDEEDGGAGAGDPGDSVGWDCGLKSGQGRWRR